MPTPPGAQADTAVAVDASVRPAAPWRVASVRPLEDHKLRVRFVDGLEGEVHMADLLTSAEAGVFARLRDKTLFDEVHVQWGAVTWPGGIDLAPDAMYDDIRTTGVCRVGPFAG